MTDNFKRLHVNDVDLTVSVAGRGVLLIWGHGLMSSMAATDAHTLTLVLRGAKLTDFPPREQI